MPLGKNYASIPHPSITISPVGLVCVAKAVVGACKAVEHLEQGVAPPSSLLRFDLVEVAEEVEVGSL